MTRRDFAAFAGGFLVSTRAFAQTEAPVLTRAIPGSGEQIPAVGLGTAYVFDENNDRREARPMQSYKRWLRTAVGSSTRPQPMAMRKAC